MTHLISQFLNYGYARGCACNDVTGIVQIASEREGCKIINWRVSEVLAPLFIIFYILVKKKLFHTIKFAYAPF